MKYISKSKFLDGLQCQKLLWMHYNAKDRIPPTDPATQAIFDQGHTVGELAKQLFPDGVEVGEGLVREFQEIFQRTRKGLATRLPLFEPALSFESGYARADILDPVETDEWDIFEVKSSTEVKDVNIDDIAFQKYVFEGAGVRIRNCFLLHINNRYVRQGVIDPKQLFTKVDVTDLVANRLPQIEAELQEMIAVIEAEEVPDIPIGEYCNDPYPCALHEYCWKDVPDHSVFSMYRLGKKAFPLYHSGVQEIVSIPADYKLSANQQIQQAVVKRSTPHVNKTVIRSFLSSLVYPLYHLDFESFNTAIPAYNGVRPYQQVPFQFSLHIQSTVEEEPEHHMFLAGGAIDPRPLFMKKLKDLIGDSGSIMAYNKSFEIRILRECVTVLPEYTEWFAKIEPRFVDLLDPFRSFSYYHPGQCGSASIKKVLPALTGISYEGEIADGSAASNEFVRVTFGEATEEDRLRVRNNLEAYCALDTLAMVKILQRLTEISK